MKKPIKKATTQFIFPTLHISLSDGAIAIGGENLRHLTIGALDRKGKYQTCVNVIEKGSDTTLYFVPIKVEKT